MDRSAVPRGELIEEIRKFMRRVGVRDAIFFGSRERGDERPHSDLNLVLLDERFAGQKLGKLLPELQKHWKIDTHVELLPCSPEEFEEMQEWNTLACDAAASGLHIHIDEDANEENDR